ncbi:MAG: ATP synthase F1 subunit epsilon [Faecalibacterium prausnitzii]|nr:ATP synthase F1 subunit epsilon [Faecalibacterium prausnitzii]
MNRFILNITASSGEFYQGNCENLVLPIGDGVYGVQAGHSPVLVDLHMGILHFDADGESRDVLVGDGIAEVTPSYVMVLVDSAERPEDIDKNRAEAARIRAEERLQHKQSMHEYYQSKIALDRAMQRLQTAAKYKR